MGDMIRAKEKIRICFNNLSTILMKYNFQICLLTFDLKQETQEVFSYC